MTPCSYDARHYQTSREAFAALDLWNCVKFADPSDRSAIDSQVYCLIDLVRRSMSIPTR